MTVEEVGAGVELPEKSPLGRLDHGRKLMQIADHQQLNPSKGLRGISESSQDLIHSVENIAPDHADLINHQ